MLLRCPSMSLSSSSTDWLHKLLSSVICRSKFISFESLFYGIQPAQRRLQTFVKARYNTTNVLSEEADKRAADDEHSCSRWIISMSVASWLQSCARDAFDKHSLTNRCFRSCAARLVGTKTIGLLFLRSITVRLGRHAMYGLAFIMPTRCLLTHSGFAELHL